MGCEDGVMGRLLMSGIRGIVTGMAALLLGAWRLIM